MVDTGLFWNTLAYQVNKRAFRQDMIKRGKRPIISNLGGVTASSCSSLQQRKNSNKQYISYVAGMYAHASSVERCSYHIFFGPGARA